MIENTIQRFARIDWANMALLTMRMERKKEVDDLVIEIIGLYSHIGEKFELRFEDTTYLVINVDFAAKRTSADAIDGAQCRSDSPWKKSLIESNPYDNFTQYFHYEIGLVPKGGSLNLLARDFTITRM